MSVFKKFNLEKLSFKKILGVSALVLFSSVALSSNSFAQKHEEIAEDYSEYNGKQCVAFVRDVFVPELPPRLFSNEDKMKLIEYGNDVCPEPGWVAIVRNGGHVAYVEDADEENGKITVVTLDGNWIGGKVYRRTGTPKELKIKGYYAP